jgi:hypothetical protein
MAKQVTDTAFYATTFKQWPVKLLGAKPTSEQLATAHAFGKHGKQSLALAMAMRDGGTTDPQIQLAVGLVDGLSRPQNNHRKAVIEAGYFKRLPVSKNERNHTVYAIALTPKGKAYIDRKAAAPKAATEAAKPKAAKKPRKAKPVDVGGVDAERTAAVTEAVMQAVENAADGISQS